jgi:hypothetical protein
MEAAVMISAAPAVVITSVARVFPEDTGPVMAR